MKRFLFSILAIYLIVSCSGRDEIPPDIVEDIIEQTALTSATINNIISIRDSVKNMDYYSPILDKYGYTIEDFEYTIERMVARKSRVLKQVLENAKSNLEIKLEVAEYIYSMNRDFETRINALYIDTLYKLGSSYKLTKNSYLDSTILYFPLEGVGKYTLKIYYASKGLSKYRNYYINAQLQDSLYSQFSSGGNTQRYYSSAYNNYNQYRGTATLSWDVENNDMGNVIMLNLFSDNRIDGKPATPLRAKRDKNGKLPSQYYKQPNILIDSILITRTPQLVDAVHKIIEKSNDFKIVFSLPEMPKQYRVPEIYSPFQFIDTIENYIPKISGVDRFIENKNRDIREFAPANLDSY